ncbi:MAG: EscV/YscV/HrcV family type III secretion system export apparatus protein [Planctomycetaceae bacterium]|nr:EscV/YscV/HrcV family type III secretion system export apparatus protein [Planctomycetaceae bacterium]
MRAGEFVLPVGLISCLIVILVPLPAAVIDLLLVGSITLSVIVLLTTIHIRKPLEFNIFPSLLLGVTLGRLVLNIATTRLILTQADHQGQRAAGGVIEAFGDFVAGGNLIVGIIIFAIIVLIQFVVITKGATRISEVAARFALDGMPGRQQAIDAELNAGNIDKISARRQRNELHQQADFLGGMDGASKFVRGDAVAGLLITVVNILGGLIIGIFQLGMSPIEAGNLFTRLTIGDGLVSQLPALLIALAAGLLVTRSSSSANLPAELIGQLFSRPRALALASLFLFLLLLTDLPKIPLILSSVGCISLSFLLIDSQKKSARAGKQQKSSSTPQIEDLLSVNPLEIELGLGLLRLADRTRGGNFLDHIPQIRNKIATDIGMVLPTVRVRDNLDLDPDEYRVKLSEMVVATGRTDSSTDLAKRLYETIEKHSAEILNRDATQFLLDQVKQKHPVVVEEIVNHKVTLADIQQTLQLLLRERLPIRQMTLILEALGDVADLEKNPVLRTEFVRRRMARTITDRNKDINGELSVIQIDSGLTETIRHALQYTPQGFSLNVSSTLVEEIDEQLLSLTRERSTEQLILLVSSDIRPAVRHITQCRLGVTVVGFDEIVQGTPIQTKAVLQEPALSTS